VSSPFYNSSNPIAAKSAIGFAMHGLKPLADYIKKLMDERKLNPRELAELTNGAITRQTVWNLINGQVKEVKDATLIALAKALKVPEEEMFAMARGRSSDSEFSLEEKRLVNHFRSLPSSIQPEVLFVVEKLSQRHAQGGISNGPINAESPDESSEESEVYDTAVDLEAVRASDED
jgi:transcriptional regulator with XRE-family HTH domain